MNFVKGFRFHPTDEELIEYLQIKTFDRDSLVQVIDEVLDICGSEPWELAGRSGLQTGDRLWYFIYQPKYKYHNSKRISRTTVEGYWKPTGNARKIINPDTGVEIGTKKTLVFYKGQYSDKNKTCWVMHEYELKPVPSATTSDHKTYHLCKLKKKPDSSSSEVGYSSQHSLSNIKNHVANNAMSEEELLYPNGLSEPEESNDSVVVHNQSSKTETYAGERSNKHNVVKDAEIAMQKESVHFMEVSTERNEPNDNNWVHNSFSTVEQDNKSGSSILTRIDDLVLVEVSNQPNIVVADAGFNVPSNLNYLVDEDLIPMDLFYTEMFSLDELLGEPEATNNSDWIQDKNATDIEDGEFLNPIVPDSKESYLQEGNRQQCLAADNKGFDLPCIDTMKSSNLIEKSRKRPRLEYDGLSHQ